MMGLVQAPLLSQTAAGVSVSVAHEGAPQSLVASGNVHAVADAPSQVAWQAPVPSHLKRPPWGAPDGSVVQVPTLPMTSHAWH